MSIYNFDIEHVNVCPKCKSNKIYNRFNNFEDTEDYRFHYDTLKCARCGFWDFPSAFDTIIMESDKSEVCPNCGIVGKVSIYRYDFVDGIIELQCQCGHVDGIEKFVGKERWEEHIRLKKEQHERAMQTYLDSLDGDDW